MQNVRVSGISCLGGWSGDGTHPFAPMVYSLQLDFLTQNFEFLLKPFWRSLCKVRSDIPFHCKTAREDFIAKLTRVACQSARASTIAKPRRTKANVKVVDLNRHPFSGEVHDRP